jgi:hypothetical protein
MKTHFPLVLSGMRDPKQPALEKENDRGKEKSVAESSWRRPQGASTFSSPHQTCSPHAPEP